jgi:hypothetical protein
MSAWRAASTTKGIQTGPSHNPRNSDWTISMGERWQKHRCEKNTCFCRRFSSRNDFFPKPRTSPRVHGNLPLSTFHSCLVSKNPFHMSISTYCKCLSIWGRLEEGRTSCMMMMRACFKVSEDKIVNWSPVVSELVNYILNTGIIMRHTRVSFTVPRMRFSLGFRYSDETHKSLSA